MAVLSLALGIGANVAIFTVINAVFLHPLAIEDPSRVAEAFTRDTRTVQVGNFNLTPSSLQNFEDFRDQNTVFSSLAGYFPFGLQWTAHGETQGIAAMMTTANYFDTLGIKPSMGRFFAPDEDIKKAAMVVVVSSTFWTTRLGSDPQVIGKTLTLNGLPFTIIGVAPPGFKGTFSLGASDRVWVPLGMREQLTTGQLRQLMTNRRFRWLGILGRLKPGVNFAQAQSEMKVIASSLEKQYPESNLGRTVEMSSVSDAALGINQRNQFLRAGGVMMAVVALVLLIACVNLANLLLAQAAHRRKEICMRAALGASRARLVRQLLVESVTLALAGGVAGLIVAYWGRNLLWSFRPPFLGAATIQLSFDGRVLGFTAGISILTGLMFGLVPAIKISQARLSETLKVGGRAGAAGGDQNRARGLLVASGISLATVALIGAGLFIRSMLAAQNLDLGFDSKHIALIGLDPGSQHYEQANGEQYYRDAISAAGSVSGISKAAVASVVPLAGGVGILLTTFPEGQPQDSSRGGSLITYNDISPGYFETLRIPLLEGRDFNEFDRDQSKLVAIVNKTTAKQLWPNQDALGKRFTVVQQTELYEVVGVVADSVINNIGEEPTPMIYRPLMQEYAPAAWIVARTGSDPEKILGSVRDQVRTLDKNMPLRNVTTIPEQIDRGLWASRMGAALLSIFGGLALLLAMIGIYGVMSYSVDQRTQEIGIRMALGARSGDVLRMVIRQGMLLVAAGAGAGILASLLLGKLIAGLLYGITPQDPVTLAGVAVALTGVALFACYVPALRATRVDPLVALRYE